MSQISPPLRIALVAAIAFLAVWMVALRPSDEAAEPAAPAPAPNVQSGVPAESAPGEVAQQAQNAANATEAGSAAQAGEAPDAAAAAGSTAAAAGSTQATPVAGGDPAAAKDSGLPMPILRAIADEKVLVLLFWNPRGGDDRAQRTAIRNLPRHGGKVYTHVANIKDVSRYASITRGVNLSQSPTTVVVDPKLGATPLVGFSARYEVDQIVSDALRVKR